MITDFNLNSEVKDDVVIMKTAGYINNAGGQVISDEFNKVKEEGVKNVIMDLAESKVVNSIGISFLIEIIEKLNENGGKLVFTNLDPSIEKTFTIMGLFQLQVGNTDWSIPEMHNIKLIKVADAGHPSPIAIPYDFDYCGIINANYAVPHEILPIESVTERFYMGTCREMGEYEDAFKLFREKRTEIASLFTNSPYLDKTGKKSSVSYLDGFYRIIDSQGSIRSVILNNCRK